MSEGGRSVRHTDHRVCTQQELAERGRTLVQIGDREIGVFWLNGHARAYENRCRHQGGPVCTGIVIGKLVARLAADQTVIREELSEDEIHLVCPWHGWEYNLETGEMAVDKRYRLHGFETTVRDGEVFVRV